MTPTDREQERAAVVAWLRSLVEIDSESFLASWLAITATAIERGDHLTDRPAP